MLGTIWGGILWGMCCRMLKGKDIWRLGQKCFRPFGWNNHLVILQNGQHKDKERYPLYVLQGSRNMELCLPPHIDLNLPKRWYCGCQGNWLCSKGAHCLPFIMAGVKSHSYSVYQCCRQQVTSKIPPKGVNVHVQHKQSKGGGGVLRLAEENDEEKKGVKEKGTWVPWKHQPVPPREAHFVETSGEGPGLLEPSPCEFRA